MDEINAFFDFSKDFKPAEGRVRGVISGNSASLAQPVPEKIVKRTFEGTAYANAVVKEEDRKLREFGKKSESDRPGPSRMERLESLMDNDDDDMDSDHSLESMGRPRPLRMDDAIYSKYNFNMQFDENLPIYDCKDEILDTIDRNPVVVLQGDTGCGKTTQVPQYILHDAYRKQQYCKIVVTQPRRIAAISIARRVAAERHWEEGTLVGYQVGLRQAQMEDTRLLFCTTGVLLQKLIQDKTLTHYTHIILDEVHERDSDMDFLMIVIRRLLATNSKHVKIILMSATIDSDEFSRYFTMRNQPAPILTVDKRRLYTVKDYYLDDLQKINLKNTTVDIDNPGISTDLMQVCVKLVVIIEHIEKREAALNSDDLTINQKGSSILIFLPGMNEIDQLYNRMEELATEAGMKIHPLRLHSMIAAEEQIKVFNQPPKGFRKVILSTNIAESSITVPDVKYVIDFCLTKVLVSDSATGFSMLQLQWASKANCKQRSGRAGRVANGRVYRLIPKNIYEDVLSEFAEPEMLRCPLENIVLKSKLLDMGSPPKILGLAMNPPNLSDIENTIIKLKQLGGLYLYSGDRYTKLDGNLTFIGRLMAALPLDIRLTRLIVLGYIYSCLDEAIIIAAGLSVRSIFNSNFKSSNGGMDSFIQKLIWSHGSGSDLFAILRAYTVWLQMREQHIRSEDSEYHWAKRYLINLRAIREMHLLISELHSRLEMFSIKNGGDFHGVRWTERERTIVLKIVIAGAFYPNYFTRSDLNDIERDRKISCILDGKDPCNTVYFTNFSTRQIGPLYSHAIKDLFREARIDPANIEVRFQSGSERVYVTFKGEVKNLFMQGHVRPEIYKAIFMRIIRMRTTIPVMDPNSAMRYVQENGIGYIEETNWKPSMQNRIDIGTIVLPSVFDKTVRGQISQIETCSKFYFQPLSERETLREICELLKEIRDEDEFENAAEIAKGMILAAPFENSYHRGKVLNVDTTRASLAFMILFIDYGNVAAIEFHELRAIPNRFSHLLHMPPRCFECRLAMIKPSYYKSPDGHWDNEAMELLQRTADDGVVEMEVFSVENGITNVIIGSTESNPTALTFNDKLVELGLATKTDESYMSKYDHDLRMRKQSGLVNYLNRDYTLECQNYKRSVLPDEEIIIDKPPPREMCKKMLNLRGPYSPLEIKYFSALNVGHTKSVNIDRSSVNCVSIDNDPKDSHERMLVSASVNTSTHNGVLIAHDTTLMPNIHGFGALMTMLFCPTMQIKTNKERTKYVTILAGLGYDEQTMESLFPENDVVLSLDVDILKSDLELIDALRYYMDAMVYTAVGSDRLSTAGRERSDVAVKIKTLLTRLLNKNRKFIETHESSRDHVWERIDPDDIDEIMVNKRSIFPMHSAVRLCDEEYLHLSTLHANCRELYDLRKFEGTIQPTPCKLCNQTFENVVQIRIHLLSQLHRDREQQTHFKL